MKINFSHEGAPSTANLSYNFNEIQDAVLLTFDNGLSHDIFFSKIADEWMSLSSLQTEHPKTYSNIIKAIIAYFITHTALTLL